MCIINPKSKIAFICVFPRIFLSESIPLLTRPRINIRKFYGDHLDRGNALYLNFCSITSCLIIINTIIKSLLIIEKSDFPLNEISKSIIYLHIIFRQINTVFFYKCLNFVNKLGNIWFVCSHQLARQLNLRCCIRLN